MLNGGISRSIRSWACLFSLSLILVLLPLGGPALAGHGTCLIDLTPNTDTNTLGQTHTVTATLTAPSGQTLDTCREGGNVDVDFEITGETGATYNPAGIDAASTPNTPDLGCRIKRNETSCTVSYTRTATAGTDSITGFFADAGIDETTDPRDTVTKTWQAPAGTRLNCEPETATNPTGTSHVVTCTVTDTAGATVAGAQVDVEITGTNDPDNADSPASPDRSCTTAANGTCTISLIGNQAGTTTFRAFIDADQNDATGGPDATEGQAEGTTAGATAEPDATDVVVKTWTATATTATRLDCNPETDSNPTGTAHVITCTATDDTGRNVGGAQIDVEASGANDPDAGESFASPDLTCTTANNGTCTITHGPGGVGTTNAVGTTTYRAWIDVDQNNATGGPDATEGQAEGTTPGATAEVDATDVVTKTWTGGASRLTISPTSDTAAVGECNPFTVTVTDAANQPVTGLTIDVEQIHALAVNGVSGDEPEVRFCTPSSGANPSGVDENRGDLRESPDNRGTAGGETSVQTNSAGQVTIGVSVAALGSATGAGDVTVRAFLETTDDDDPDTGEPQATATKTWTGTSPRPVCPGFENDPRNQVVGTLGNDTLSGTEGADIVCGLAGNDSLSALGGDDLILGGPGNDVLSGGDGTDVLRGGPGNDIAAGGAGNDLISGGRGSDLLLGGAGNDMLRGGAGADSLFGNGGTDLLRGGAGKDSLDGGGARDSCRGGSGRDRSRSC
jgi:Ca2+-binding RTX toxin-like protein